MKTKLLRKVRKRFEIIHYPNGVSTQYPEPCIRFLDKCDSLNNETLNINIYTPEGYIIDKYKRAILRIIRRECGKYFKKKNKYKGTKLWYT